ncbi:MAG: hypothetical protein ACTSYC_00275 [Promethearchaeota archaeon]
MAFPHYGLDRKIHVNPNVNNIGVLVEKYFNKILIPTIKEMTTNKIRKKSSLELILKVLRTLIPWLYHK